jgi:alkanesulfonate monooxygenase SsuD/methylene tetrahydromethanopterin reductase-like flavin-dependent oxidoreductase (luciferase family)
MRYGLSVPNFGSYGHPALLVDLALEAEGAGWDGFFVWDHVRLFNDFSVPVVDPWVALGAIAQATGQIRIGPMVTPVSRRRPYKLARETVTLDHLSSGRLIFGVGLGEPPLADFDWLGETSDNRGRADLLDEGLDVITHMWSGEQLEHHGKAFAVEGPGFLPLPVQSPRIPIWVAGAWPNRRPFRRAAKWDGVVPIVVGGELGFHEPSLDEFAEIVGYVAECRTSSQAFDLVASGSRLLYGDADLDSFAALGTTWWLESIGYPGPAFDDWRDVIRSGPPA